MRKGSALGVGGKGERQRRDFEADLAALFSELSQIYDTSSLIRNSLKRRKYDRSYAEMVEVEVLLKNALRILCDAMSHLPIRT